MTSTNRRVTAIATGQHGIVSRAAAHAAGVSDAALRSRVESGFLVQFGAHTFRLAGSTRDAVDLLRGVLADVGAPAWACGTTAVALHGFDGWALRRPFHILLPRGRYLRRSAVTLHTGDDLPPIDLEEQFEVATTSPTRTIIDLAAASTRDQLAFALDSARRDGLTSEPLLHRRIAALRGKGRRGPPALVDVLDGRDVVRRGHSWLEREFLHLLTRAGLPRPVTQQVLARAGGRVCASTAGSRTRRWSSSCSATASTGHASRCGATSSASTR